MNDVGAVSKNDQNKQQGFKYRGIDAVMNALQPAMIKNRVFVAPTVLSEERTERATKTGSVLFYTRLKIRYTFFTEDGSNISADVIGEAMDSGDKATNKAMSIAYKYACFQVFCIPTEEMQDPDKESHEVEPQAIQNTKVHGMEPQNVQAQEVQGTKPQNGQTQDYVDAIKIKVLKEEMKQKGVEDEKVLSRYKLSRFEDMKVIEFINAMNVLEKMQDVGKEVDLGL